MAGQWESRKKREGGREVGRERGTKRGLSREGKAYGAKKKGRKLKCGRRERERFDFRRSTDADMHRVSMHIYPCMFAA